VRCGPAGIQARPWPWATSLVAKQATATLPTLPATRAYAEPRVKVQLYHVSGMPYSLTISVSPSAMPVPADAVRRLRPVLAHVGN